MELHPYLQFGGRCAEAFAFYARHLHLQDVTLMPFRGSPGEAQAPEEWRDKIMHASARIGSGMLMGSDGMPGQPHEGIKGCSLALSTANDAEAERLFDALAQNGTVTMPLQATFWASKFGMLTDQFGVGWMVWCERPQGASAP